MQEETDKKRQHVLQAEAAPPLTFGMYAGSGGTEMERRFNDDPAKIEEALDRLQGNSRLFVVRGYQWYIGAGKTGCLTPVAIERYANDRRKLDMVLCFRDPQGDLEGWLQVIRETIQTYGPALASIQITEEPNNPNPELGGDGAFPNIYEAIIQGVIAAKAAARHYGYTIAVGFNATPSFAPTDNFWPYLGTLVTPEFLNALDYVGLDFFPDVFRPLAPDGEPGDLHTSVTALLKYVREINLAAGHIPSSVPIYIGENGWPTGPDRPYERQAAVLETIVRTIYEQRESLNITHYMYHGLRDADSNNTNLFYQFGLMRDDYTPKPAFETYRRLIAELGTPG